LTFWVQAGGSKAEDLLNDITLKLNDESPHVQPLVDIRIGTVDIRQ